jgi:aminoglycoside phosphotransferase (APT) family kinase protein
MMDRPTAVRPGEELDSTKLAAYLSASWNKKMNTVAVQQFPGGYSNLTYSIKIDQDEYVLRRPPIGANIKSAHDMGREFTVLASLRDAGYSKAPEPIHFCDDESVIGSKFYLMKRVSGTILRNKVPAGLTIAPETFKQLSQAAIEGLVELHHLNITNTALSKLGKPDGYVERQVKGWTQRYDKAKTDDIASMDEVGDWINKHIPRESATAFIHNDYKYDNLVLDERDLTKVKAVLDWEMSTVGDPLMDLGTTLAYWAEPQDADALKPFSLTWMPGNISRMEALNYYQEKSGNPIRDFVFYYAFGTFKIGVICQQIYFRYKQGVTQDPRFALLIHVIRACGENGRKAIEKMRI